MVNTVILTKKLNEIYGNLYIYDKINYINSKTPVIIICNKHGEFKKRPNEILNGFGCPKCANILAGESRKKNGRISLMNTNIFINKANKKHNNFYDYSKVNYKHSQEKIIIICPEHGEFTQLPSSHLFGSKCTKCSKTESDKKRTFTTEKFIVNCNLIHNNFYDYSKVDYKHSQEKIIIICPEHGEFTQLPAEHLRGTKCKLCSNNDMKLNNIEFIAKSNIVHENKYSYHKINYIHSKQNIIIHCTEEDKNGLVHGDFEQKPNQHLNGQGCPKCALKFDKSELEVLEFIKALNIENIITNDRIVLNGKEIDIYLPDYNVAIEYNGLYWHSENQGKDNKYHLKKTEECLKQGIQLIHIFEDEWIYKKEIVKSRLLYILNKIDKSHIAYGRNCFVKEINDKSIIRNFLERNHIQGFVGSKINLGLYTKVNNKEYLLSIMTFGELRKSLGNSPSVNCYELLRFCNAINYSVMGGASKLLKYFENNYKPEKIISYADRRWSIGNLYKQLNFQQIKISPPNYFYISGQKRLHRFNFRKDILISKYGCSHKDTENNFTKNVLGLNRIYDCGTLVYEKN